LRVELEDVEPTAVDNAIRGDHDIAWLDCPRLAWATIAILARASGAPAAISIRR
jgi:hypothetical protein